MYETGSDGLHMLRCRNAVTQRGALLPGLCLRGFHASGLQCAAVTVTVPSMGDSISEGTVASLEKKPGARPTCAPSCLGLVMPSMHAPPCFSQC